MHKLFAVALAVALACRAQKPDAAVAAQGAPAEVEQRCFAAEIARAPDAAVRALLSSADAAVRERAALACGRTHDAEAVPQLAALLADAKVGATAAWALGRIDKGEPALVECVQRSCAALAAAARALAGASRSSEAIDALAAALTGPADAAAAAATSLAIIERLGGTREKSRASDAVPALVAALARPEPTVRAAAAYALERASKREGVESLPAALGAALRDPAAEVREHAAGAAVKLGAKAADLARLLDDADWRVRVQAARAMAGAPGAAEAIAAAIPAQLAKFPNRSADDAKWAHALVALFEAAARAGGAARVAVPAPRTLSAATGPATVAVRCAAAAARDRATGWVEETKSCGRGLEPEWRGRMRAGALAVELGAKPDSPAHALAVAALADADGRVRGQTAAAAGAAFAGELTKLLDDGDPYVVSEAAGSLAKDAATARESLPAALRAVERFRAEAKSPAGPPGVDALVALVQLIAAAKKSDTSGWPDGARDALQSLLPPGSAPLSTALLPALPDAPVQVGGPVPADAEAGKPGKGPRPERLAIATTQGDLVFALHSGDGEAPLTAAALAALARKKFYDGLSFHRVVPDFVIQGGDPRGDGDGGPGWALPDEHTPRPFLRGTLGIATSGPETGGSQIFACHAPQPHLDGRYTVVGQLVSGEEVLDAIQIGDSILGVRVE